MGSRIDRTPQDGDERTEEQSAAVNAEAERSRLDDPEVQRKIENPEELRYTLRVPDTRVVRREVDGEALSVVEDYERERRLRVRVALTPNDVQRRNVVDYIEQHYRTAGAEVAESTGDRTPNLFNYMRERPARLEAALCAPGCRQLARRIFVALAKPDPEDGDQGPITTRDVEDGLVSGDLLAFQISLLIQFLELVSRAKKTPARPSSGKPRSTRPSRRRSGGPAKK